MVRRRLGLAWKGALAAAFVATACGEVAGDRGIGAPGGTPGSTGGSSANSGGTAGASSGGSSGGTRGAPDGPITVGVCASGCCPRDEFCYRTPAVPEESGRECIALHDNTGKSHIQLRQTSVEFVYPVTMSELIRRARNSDLQLPLTGLDGETSCFGADRTGVGKLIQLIDFEVDSGTARGVGSTGYSRPIPPWESAVEVAEGFCMVGGEYPGTAQYRLRDDQLGDLSKYLPGLKPSGLATKSWLAQPGRYLRQPADFDVSTYRKTLPEPPVGAYFYDAVAGRFHSYAVSLSMVQYALEPDVVPIVFPLHEVETRITFNDPAHPNCSGAVSPTVECLDVPRWSGVVCHERTCTPDPGAFAEYAGYLFITELEQVYMPAVFEMTGCVSFLTKGRAAADGWLTADEKSCKTANWNPAAPNDEGLPRGDWCAVTNSPATATCHDAVRFHERATYAATKIRGATGPASVPQICPFG